MSITQSRTEEVGAKVPQDHLFTIEEAAEYLRTSVSTLRYWQGISKGPKSFKLGVRRLYKQSDLDAWVESQYLEQTRSA